MTRIWFKIFLLSIWLPLLKGHNYANHENLDSEIVYCKNFTDNYEILAHFVDNSMSAIDIRKIKSFFIFPTQFYQENTICGSKFLPLFLINATKKEFCSFLFVCYNFNTLDDTRKEKLQISPRIEIEIVKIHEDMVAAFQDAGEFNRFIRSILPDFDESELFALISFRTFLFNQVRCLVPLIYFQSLNFFRIPETKKSIDSMLQEKRENYSDFNLSKLVSDDWLVKMGSGGNSVCLKTGLYLRKSNEFRNDILFKILNKSLIPQNKSWDLDELTVFQNAGVEDKSRFNAMECLVIDRNTGYGVGFLARLAKYGDLKSFIEEQIDEFDLYFFDQMLELAKSIEFLHENGICHCDIHEKNVLVDKKEQHQINFNDNVKHNYRFLLADFGLNVNPHENPYLCQSLKVKQFTEDSAYGCENCINIFREDWCQFKLLLKEIFKLQALKHAKTSLKCNDFLILVVSPKVITNYSQAKKYFNDFVFNDLVVFNNTKIHELYEFKEDADFLISNWHGRNRISKKIEILAFNTELKYSLYHVISGKNQWIMKIKSKNIAHEINLFAKKNYKIENLLEQKFVVS